MPQSYDIELNTPEAIPNAIQGVVNDVIREISSLDYTRILSAEMATIEKHHAGYFSRQRDPSGHPWAPLRPSTVAKKGHNKILVDHGRLMASLTGAGPGAIRLVRNQELIFGTSVPYAKFHMTGWTIRSGRVPRSGSQRPSVPSVSRPKTSGSELNKAVRRAAVRAPSASSRVPARPPVGLSTKAVSEIVNNVADGIIARMGGARTPPAAPTPGGPVPRIFPGSSVPRLEPLIMGRR